MDTPTKILIAVIALSVLVYTLYQLRKDKIPSTKTPNFNEQVLVSDTSTSSETNILTEDKLKPTPTLSNKEKGDLYEVYTIERLGTIKGNEFIDRNSDYHTKNVSASANVEPDLKFRFKDIEYAVECKYRSKFKNLTWAKERQLNTYKKYQNDKNQKVLISLGIGGTADKPKHFYMIPLDHLNKVELSYEDIKDYKVFDFIPLKSLLEIE